MVCLRLKPGATGWKTQTNLLSYGGTPLLWMFIFFESLPWHNRSSGPAHLLNRSSFISSDQHSVLRRAWTVKNCRTAIVRHAVADRAHAFDNNSSIVNNDNNNNNAVRVLPRPDADPAQHARRNRQEAEEEKVSTTWGGPWRPWRPRWLQRLPNESIRTLYKRPFDQVHGFKPSSLLSFNNNYDVDNYNDGYADDCKQGNTLLCRGFNSCCFIEEIRLIILKIFYKLGHPQLHFRLFLVFWIINTISQQINVKIDEAFI